MAKNITPMQKPQRFHNEEKKARSVNKKNRQISRKQARQDKNFSLCIA